MKHGRYHGTILGSARGIESPGYDDFGFGAIDQTWEAYTGAGYAFNHGQTLLVAWRALNYNAFPPGFHVQKLTLGGPLLGYTFNL